jgi:hypothetical protein
MKRIFISLVTLIITAGLCAQSLVYIPTLKNPANGAIKQMPNATVSWNAITGSLNLQYQVQVDTTTNFNSPLLVDATQTLLTGYTLNELLFGQTYYWRVRAIDGQTSGWSTIWSFTVLSQIELSTPPTGGIPEYDPNIKLVWKNTVNSITLTGVTYFDYQADTTTNFNSPALVQGTVAGTVYTVPTANLIFGATYYWRARAGHAKDVSDWADPKTFLILDKVTLQNPSNNNVNQMLNATLKWKVVLGIIGYEYDVATDAGFTNLVLSSETDTNVVTSQFLMFGIQYYWRVRARHATDTTSWGTPFTFTTINTVLLKTPANLETDVATKPTVTWTGQTGIIGFQLQVSSESSFTDPLIDVNLDPELIKYTLNKTLNSQTTYYWRMRAHSNGGVMADTTDWSETWSFVTGFPAGIDDNKAQNFSLYPNPAKEKIFVRINSPEATTGQFILMDLIGKTTVDQPLSLEAGSNLKEINLEGVGKGIYVVRITVNGRTINQKLIVE